MGSRRYEEGESKEGQGEMYHVCTYREAEKYGSSQGQHTKEIFPDIAIIRHVSS